MVVFALGTLTLSSRDWPISTRSHGICASRHTPPHLAVVAGVPASTHPPELPFLWGLRGEEGLTGGCGWLWLRWEAMYKRAAVKTNREGGSPSRPIAPAHVPCGRQLRIQVYRLMAWIDIGRSGGARDLYDFNHLAGRGFVPLCLSPCARQGTSRLRCGDICRMRGAPAVRGVGCARGMRRAACGMGKEIDVGVSRLGIGAATDWVAAAARQPLPRHGMAWFVT